VGIKRIVFLVFFQLFFNSKKYQTIPMLSLIARFIPPKSEDNCDSHFHTIFDLVTKHLELFLVKKKKKKSNK
jgi:hypothetical protein